MSIKYEVLKIDELSKLSDEGGTEKYYRHKVKTAGGTVITVDIDKENFTPEKATPILEAAATNADAVLRSGN